MEGWWIVSYVVLWVLVAALAGLLISLLRLVGALYERVGPTGAAVLDDGPEVGDEIGPELADLLGAGDRRATAAGTLLVFLSPDCRSCDELLPGLTAYARRVRDEARVGAVSTAGGAAANRRFEDVFLHEPVTFRAAPEAARRLGVDTTPYALWVDEEGVVRAKGVVNHMEHLESLKTAHDLGYSSVGEYTRAHLRRDDRPSVSV